MTSTSCEECGQVHERCSKHRKRRGPDGRKVPCGAKPVRGLTACRTHSGKRVEVAKAEGRRNLDRADAERQVETYRARLGVAAADESHEVTALTQIRVARGNVAAWQHLVDALVDAAGGDVLKALGVHTGNEKKPNEVEKHFALARLDEERDRLMGWIATARKLGIEEARLEQQERIAQADAERVIAVIRATLDALRAELLERGTERAVIEATYREVVPKLVANAIAATGEAAA